MTRRQRPLNPAPDADVAAILRRVPKIELHLHLEGSLRPQTVREQANRYAPGSPLAQPGWERDFWRFTDLPSFIPEFGTVLRTTIRSAADYYRVARECFEDLVAQNVIYAEPSFGPRTPGQPFYVPLGETLAAIDQARREVEARKPLRIGLILGFSRTHLMPDGQSAATLARDWLEEALAARKGGLPLCGVDLHGDERGGARRRHLSRRVSRGRGSRARTSRPCGRRRRAAKRARLPARSAAAAPRARRAGGRGS